MYIQKMLSTSEDLARIDSMNTRIVSCFILPFLQTWMLKSVIHGSPEVWCVSMLLVQVVCLLCHHFPLPQVNIPPVTCDTTVSILLLLPQTRMGECKYILLFYFCILVFCEDEGKCSSEKETCEDDKQNYTKIMWTNDYDYQIRIVLDEADDVIAKDQPKAAKMFENILEKHPKSARAKYALARTLELIMVNETDLDEQTKICDRAREMLKQNLVQEDVNDLMESASASLLMKLSDLRPICYSIDDQIEALRVISRKEPEGRHAIVLCQELFIKGNYDEALDRIENLLKLKPEEFLLNILKTTILKLRGQEKEANKILRNLDLDETLESLEKNPEEIRSLLPVIINDINHLCLSLLKSGKHNVIDILLKVRYLMLFSIVTFA